MIHRIPTISLASVDDRISMLINEENYYKKHQEPKVKFPCEMVFKAVKVGFNSMQTTVICGERSGKNTLLCDACHALFKDISFNEGHSIPDIPNQEKENKLANGLKEFLKHHPYIVGTVVFLSGASFFVLPQVMRHINAGAQAEDRLDIEKRIIKGQDVTLNSNACFMAFIKDINDMQDSHCGGTIVSDNQVVTAAHCISISNEKSPSQIRVNIGSVDRSKQHKFIVKKIEVRTKKHEKPGRYYNLFDSLYSDANQDDLAILTVDRPFPKDRVCRLNLISKADSILLEAFKTDFPPTCQLQPTLKVYGWGLTKPLLQVHNHGLRTPERLKIAALRNYKSINRSGKRECSSNKLCAGYFDSKSITDTCQSDSGGPVLFQNQCGDVSLAGVVSSNGRLMDDCADGHLAEYTDINFHREWLKSKISPSSLPLFSGSVFSDSDTKFPNFCSDAATPPIIKNKCSEYKCVEVTFLNENNKMFVKIRNGCRFDVTIQFKTTTETIVKSLTQRSTYTKEGPIIKNSFAFSKNGGASYVSIPHFFNTPTPPTMKPTTWASTAHKLITTQTSSTPTTTQTNSTQKSAPPQRSSTQIPTTTQTNTTQKLASTKTSSTKKPTTTQKSSAQTAATTQKTTTSTAQKSTITQANPTEIPTTTQSTQTNRIPNTTAQISPTQKPINFTSSEVPLDESVTPLTQRPTTNSTPVNTSIVSGLFSLGGILGFAGLTLNYRKGYMEGERGMHLMTRPFRQCASLCFKPHRVQVPTEDVELGSIACDSNSPST